MSDRQPDGKFGPGNRANPGGRPKMDPAIKEALAALTKPAVEALAELLHSEDDAIRMRAVSEVLDRNLGKAIQSVEHSGADGESLSIAIRFVDTDGSSS